MKKLIFLRMTAILCIVLLFMTFIQTTSYAEGEDEGIEATALSSSDSSVRNSSIGFLMDSTNGMGWSSALTYFNSITSVSSVDPNGKVITSYTAVGADKDATSLDNLETSLNFIIQSNTLRAKHGACALKVSAKALLQAEIVSNFTRLAAFDHPRVFGNSENLSAGFSDPFSGWYTYEKSLYDSGNTSYSDTGHYQNIIKGSFVATGFGISQGGRYSPYAVQEFSTIGTNSSDVYMTPETCLSKLKAYRSSLSGSSSGSTGESTDSSSDSSSSSTSSTTPTGVTLSKSTLAMNKGTGATLTATVSPSTASQSVTWSSSNKSVATVSSGKINALSAGSTTITAKTSNGKTATCKVTVLNTSIPVYRLYSPVTGEHLYTTDANEKETLWKKCGWGYEGVAWYAPTSGEAVYRLYNAKLKNHLYTTDTNEVKVLTSKHGWTADNNRKALFYSGGTVPIYRVYNASQNGMHHLTTDANEYKTLPKYGWKQEGVCMYAIKTGKSITTNYYR